MTLKGFFSSTAGIPEVSDVPRHIAVIMDGNGRWAKKHRLPRVAGHARGVGRVKEVVEACVRLGIGHLTLFAFSSENWRRPTDEVSKLMELFSQALEREVASMHRHGIRLRIIGDKSRFHARLQHLIREAEQLTGDNERMTLTVAANYGGRWDILQAINGWLKDHPGATVITEEALTPYLSMADAPEPDLFIRTGGEQRISNFLLWQLAYTELYFTPTLWPDFDAAELNRAIAWYRQRERRFGRTSEQIQVG
ncbi:MAG: polyprenyl diphosphate synthase [Thiobacillaceae bacterium]